MQYRTHGIAARRLLLISCPQFRQSPNVPSLIRLNTASTKASSARSRDFCARSISLARGDRVTDRMRFKFKDGSIYEETTVFSQRGTFRLLSNHVVQKGPLFKRTMETSIDATSGQVTVRYSDDHSTEKLLTEHLELPPDVANGILFTLVKNVQPSVPKTTVSYVAVTPKPRLVNLESFHKAASLSRLAATRTKRCATS
jgi:hypothetical protein